MACGQLPLLISSLASAYNFSAEPLISWSSRELQAASVTIKAASVARVKARVRKVRVMGPRRSRGAAARWGTGRQRRKDYMSGDWRAEPALAGDETEVDTEVETRCLTVDTEAHGQRLDR